MTRPPLRQLLKATSRSFYLSLAALPTATRDTVGLAYLLARAADSVADTTFVPAVDRQRLLAGLRGALEEGGDPGPGDGQGNAFVAAAREATQALVGPEASPGGAIGSAAERALLQRFPDAALALGELPERDRHRVSEVLRTIIEGMELDLQWFPAGEDRAAEPPALTGAADLGRYCDHVAGCVGRFWTHVHFDHLPSLRKTNRGQLLELGTRYGEALQLTNILRDVPRDLDRGRCYLPEDALAACGLSPATLRAPVRRLKAIEVMRDLLRKALEGYEAGAAYCLALPTSELRLRLATALPLVIGLPTIERIAAAQDPLNPGLTIKVPRRQVYRLLTMTASRIGSTGALRGWFRRLGRPVGRQLGQGFL
ncbi:MAG: phytoene/squalene synthase family protein [Planctomycetota bacterium]|jgi:farnesyl-diphosphate farnesyltransferase